MIVAASWGVVLNVAVDAGQIDRTGPSIRGLMALVAYFALLFTPVGFVAFLFLAYGPVFFYQWIRPDGIRRFAPSAYRVSESLFRVVFLNWLLLAILWLGGTSPESLVIDHVHPLLNLFRFWLAAPVLILGVLIGMLVGCPPSRETSSCRSS